MRIIRLDEPEGNPYSIMGIAAGMLRQIHGAADAQEVIDKYREEAQSGDYKNLQAVTKRYLPELIEFAYSDEVRVTETIVRRGEEEE